MATALGHGFEDAAPARTTGRYRLGDVRHVFASPKRAMDQLGWRAEVDFAAGMRELAGDVGLGNGRESNLARR